MHHKNIKPIVRKQLKSNYPNWKSLTKKGKKRMAKMVIDEVVKDYDFNQEISDRKFCDDDKSYKGHKENRSYIGMENVHSI